MSRLSHAAATALSVRGTKRKRTGFVPGLVGIPEGKRMGYQLI